VKDSRIYLVLSAIYIEPHVLPSVGIAIGVYFAACAFHAMWKNQ
jgi:hypothetical protein